MTLQKESYIDTTDLILGKIEFMGVSIIVTEPPTVSLLPRHLLMYDYYNIATLITFGPASYSVAPIKNRGIDVMTFDYPSSTALTKAVSAEWQSFMHRKIINAYASPKSNQICILDDTAGVKATILLSILMYHWGLSLENALRRSKECFPRAVLTSEEDVFLCKQMLNGRQLSRTKRLIYLFRRYAMQLGFFR